MHRLASAVLLLAVALPARAQDIFLARITTDATGKRAVETPVNITNRAGYDNQPSFTADARMVLYTSTREDQQADIYSYNIETRAITRLTQTAPESEYSASVMPSGDRFSVIRVERDSSQRLWSFRMDGSDPQVVVPDVKPVGYHTWIGASRIAMFVLGSPNSLQLYDTGTRRADTVTTGIGRSLVTLPVPGTGSGVAAQPAHFSFVKRDGAAFTLHTVDTREVRAAPKSVVALPQGSEYVVWLSASLVIAGQDSKLLMYDTVAGGTWTELADFSAAGVTRISRLAVGNGARGQWIAIVAEPRAQGTVR